MNDQRFIELVNLYIDREITAAETAELEIEIQSNPRRRAIYNQYCKLNRATSMVYDSFRAQAGPVKRSAGQATIEKFETAKRQRRTNWGLYAGGIAAAACVAFALVQFKGEQVSANPMTVVAQSNVASAKPLQIATASDQSVAEGKSPAAATVQLASLRRDTVADENFAELLSNLRDNEQRSFADAQLKLMRSPSLFEDGVFDAKLAPASFNQRTLRSQSSQSAQAEFTAFQFQR